METNDFYICEFYGKNISRVNLTVSPFYVQFFYDEPAVASAALKNNLVDSDFFKTAKQSIKEGLNNYILQGDPFKHYKKALHDEIYYGEKDYDFPEIPYENLIITNNQNFLIYADPDERANKSKDAVYVWIKNYDIVDLNRLDLTINLTTVNKNITNKHILYKTENNNFKWLNPLVYYKIISEEKLTFEVPLKITFDLVFKRANEV